MRVHLTRSLYAKLFAWLILNALLLVSIGVAFFAWLLFGSSEGLFPPHIFSSRAEDLCRTISADLQYRPFESWGPTVEVYDKKGKYQLAMMGLGKGQIFYTSERIPEEIMEAAEKIPHTPFTLCPAQDKIFNERSGFPLSYDLRDQEMGLVSQPPVLFKKVGENYWYGRTLFIPDNTEMLHYVLLTIKSPTLMGDGLFFDFRGEGFVILLALGISFLWWVPFIWHIVSPLHRMVRYSKMVTTNIGLAVRSGLPVSGSRKDEIGELNRSMDVMVRQLARQMSGQQLFIRHIAHELNTPLAHSMMRLTNLQEDLEDEGLRRYVPQVQKILGDMEMLSHLTEDVLTFLRSQMATENKPRESVRLMDFLFRQISTMNDGRISVDFSEDVTVFINPVDLSIAVGNAIRNALFYAGGDAHIALKAEAEEKWVVLHIQDNGPGVPEHELEHIMEPFFRGQSAQSGHPGGTGLGLAIIKTSLEHNGGDAWCCNVAPHGFCVSMRIPRCLSAECREFR